jgi:hypothetical protein
MRESDLLREIGQQKACSSRGKTKDRSIKAKPRPKFAPRRVGAKVTVRSVITQIEVLS